MNIQIPFKKTLLPTLISSTMMLTGCGSSSDSDNSDNDNGGTLTSGIITGFGSIYVNGIEFETDSASYDIDDDIDADQDDLRIGMRVEINGTINADGLTGTANSVNYENELEGPVSDIDDTTVPGDIILTILGQLVTVNADTRFDNDDNDLDMLSIQLNDLLEVSGYTSTNGIIATHIEKQTGSFDADNPENSKIELKGGITDLTTDSFNVNGFNVTYSSLTELDDIPNNTLTEGLFVEVKGSLNSTADTLIANKIEAENNSFSGDADEVEIEGIIQDLDTEGQTFVVQDQLVDFSMVSELNPSSLTLENDLKIEVEGELIDGTLIAEEIKLKGRKIKIQARISAVSTTAETIAFSLFGGTDNVTVRINQQTDMEDDLSESDVSFTLADLVEGDFVEVEAFDEGLEIINAIELKRQKSDVDDTQLQGPITAKDAILQTVTLFGETFILPAEAKFEADNGDEFNDVGAFLSDINIGSFIEITDEDPDGDGPDTTDGVIDKVEIEEEDDD